MRYVVLGGILYQWPDGAGWMWIPYVIGLAIYVQEVSDGRR